MKKKKKKSVSLSPALVGLLFLTAMSLGTIGVIHAVMKNRQLTLGRKTQEVGKRIAEHERDLTNLEITLGLLQHHRELRPRLALAESQLVPIPQTGVVEDIYSYNRENAVALLEE